MHVLWKKRLQHIIKEHGKPFNGMQQQIVTTMETLKEAQQNLVLDRMNEQKIENTKKCTKTVLKLSYLKENVLKQISKIDWLKLGDSNNAFFHASLKSKLKQTQMATLMNTEGRILDKQNEIEEGIIIFYGNLVGSSARCLQGMDIEALRKRKQM